MNTTIRIDTKRIHRPSIRGNTSSTRIQLPQDLPDRDDHRITPSIHHPLSLIYSHLQPPQYPPPPVSPAQLHSTYISRHAISIVSLTPPPPTHHHLHHDHRPIPPPHPHHHTTQNERRRHRRPETTGLPRRVRPKSISPIHSFTHHDPTPP